MLSFRVFVTLHPCWLVFSLPPFSSTSRSPYALPSSVCRNPVFAILTKTAGVWGYSSHFGKPCGLGDEKSLFHSSSFFSHPCALFCTHQELNSFVFKRLRTLYAKTPGGGVPLHLVQCGRESPASKVE